MAANFLHGIETVEVQKGARTVSVVKTAIIGLVGIAPEGPAGVTLVSSDKDAAQFGAKIPGFLIPQALNFIFSQGAGTIVVVNVFNADTHLIAVQGEAQTVTGGKLKLASYPVGVIAITDQAGAAVNYVKGTDYSFDNYGNFTVLGGAIPDNTTLKFTYKKLNDAAVTDNDIIGSVSATGLRTGIKALDLAFNLYGFNPKILLAPGYSHHPAVAAELFASATKLRAIPLIDAVTGWTVSQALQSRGQANSAFNTSFKRAYLLYPYLAAYDEATTINQNFPYSIFMAGVMAATDNTYGYWYSPSNKLINDVVGTELPISSIINDANSDANLLNAAGITTIFNSYGTGFKTWGNRSAAFPTNTDPDNFISIRRIADVVEETMENATVAFSDQPITQAFIDDVRDTGNAMMNVFIGRGALIQGSKVVYNQDDNAAIELAAGHIVFELDFMGPPPAERITLKSYININLLSNLK